MILASGNNYYRYKNSLLPCFRCTFLLQSANLSLSDYICGYVYKYVTLWVPFEETCSPGCYVKNIAELSKCQQWQRTYKTCLIIWKCILDCGYSFHHVCGAMGRNLSDMYNILSLNIEACPCSLQGLITLPPHAFHIAKCKLYRVPRMCL